MTDYSLRALRFSILFIVMLMVCYQALGHFKFLSSENETYEVELIQWERYGPAYSDVRFVLLVGEKATKAERTVVVENLTTGLDRAEIVDRTLVLFGERRSKADAITLVDLEAARTTDFILSYGFDLSPSKRYLVFRKFYPPRGMAATLSDVVLVYDVANERSMNWLPGSPGAPAGMNVGFPVYPHENVDPATYRVWIPEEDDRHHVSRFFLWTRDEKSLFFTDKTRNQRLLVRVDLEEGLQRPRITTQPIDAMLAREGSSEGKRQYYKVTGLEFGPDGRICFGLKFDRRKTQRCMVAPEDASPTQKPVEELQ